MKKFTYFIYILVFILIFFSKNLNAETIVYIDMDKIMQVSKVGKSATEKLNKINETNINKFTKIEKKLKKDEEDLISKRNVLSKEEFEKKIQELRNKVNDYRKERQAAIEDVTKKRINASADFAKKIKPILAEYAKENSIDIVIQKKNILMGKSKLDITNEILKIVDKKISKLNIN